MRIKMVVPLALLATAVTAVVVSFQYRFSAAIGPFVLGAMAALILLVLLFREGLSKGEEKSKGARQDAIRYRPHLQFAIWAISLALAVWILGAPIAFTVFAFVYLRAYRESWLLSIAISAGVFLVFYLGFEQGLKILLPKGVIFG